jgi:hypothetical protein
MDERVSSLLGYWMGSSRKTGYKILTKKMGHNPKRQELLIHRGKLPEHCVRVGSFRSCHRRTRRSIVRRVLGPIPGWRLQIPRKTATGRSPGVALSIGTISFFQMRANRSGVWRPPFRGTKRWSGASALQSFMGVLRGR